MKADPYWRLTRVEYNKLLERIVRLEAAIRALENALKETT